MATNTYERGLGRRKCAIAQVKLFPGTGKIIVNGQPYEKFFSRYEHRRTIEQPFLATETTGKYDVDAKVVGGGMNGWADAICLGIARAMIKQREQARPVLRQAGLLTRDPRVKERKKYGLKRARKAPQYTKR